MEKIIVALDLGTHSIKGIVGKRNEMNVFSILADASIPSENCIRRGIVYNIEETGAKINKLINLLENKLKKSIKQAYISINGQSVRSVNCFETAQITKGIVTEEVIEKLNKELQKINNISEIEYYGIGDVEYFLDGKSEKNPIGITCNNIEANYKLIAGKTSLKSNIRKSIESKTNLKIADYKIGSKCSTSILLNEEEKELGCIFIDFGAGTTSVSIYKFGILQHFVVIPLGGKAITKDLCGLNLLETEAEQYKIQFGKAFENNITKNQYSPFSNINVKPKDSLDIKSIDKIIQLRLDEIIANINEQIKISGFEKENLSAGIIITGGASLLSNMDMYLIEKFKMPVKRAIIKKTLVNNFPEVINNPSMTQVIGTFVAGEENCIEENIDEIDYIKTEKIVKKNNKEKNSKNFMSKVGNVLGGLFSDTENDNNE